jgi:xanthine dehydrogenase small subunit
LVRSASIGVGGVAATPVRARQTEARLTGQPWNETSLAQAADTLSAEFQPLSDMRASSSYRRALLANLLQRYWLESTGPRPQLATLIPLAQSAAAEKAPS